MAFQPAPQCAQVTLEFRDISTGEHIGENTVTFHADSNENYTADALNSLLVDINTVLYAELRTYLPSSVRLQRMTARGLDSELPAYAELNTAWAGQNVSARVPSSVTLALSFKTGVTGRTARGRMFICGLPITQVEDDYVNGAYAENLRSLYGDAFAARAGTDTHVVLSRYFNNTKRLTATWRAVTTYAFTDLRIDTRRLRIR